MKEQGKAAEHYFNVEYAKKYGAEEAIVLNNIIFWVSKNGSKAKNFRYGRYWMYCSVNQFRTYYHPYFSVAQMRRILDSLIKQKVIFKRDYNVANYSNPSWFTVVDKSMLLKNHPVAKDKLDTMSREELKKFIDRHNLDMLISNTSEFEIKKKIREHPKFKNNLEDELQLEFPDAVNDWYTVGDDDDELFADEKDEYDEMNANEIRQLAKRNKINITKDMDMDDVRNEIRWIMNKK